MYAGRRKYTGVKIFNVTGSLSATPSEDLLEYVDVSVNTSKVTKSLGIGAAIQKFEFIKYDGATVSPSDNIDILESKISLTGSTTSITATCNASYTYNDGNVYYPYTVRIYYYPDSYVGCTMYTLNSSTSTALPDNTFMIFVSVSGTTIGQHAWVYPASGTGLVNVNSGTIAYIANTSNGIFAKSNSYTTKIYCYYWK